MIDNSISTTPLSFGSDPIERWLCCLSHPSRHHRAPDSTLFLFTTRFGVSGCMSKLAYVCETFRSPEGHYLAVVSWICFPFFTLSCLLFSTDRSLWWNMDLPILSFLKTPPGDQAKHAYTGSQFGVCVGVGRDNWLMGIIHWETWAAW